MVPSTDTEILGRRVELEAIEQLLSSPARGPIGLVIEGEPGIGKSTLWSHGTRAARDSGWLVLASETTEAEADLALSCLGDLMGAIPRDALDVLPPAHRRAIEGAVLGHTDASEVPDPRALALAVLGVVRAVVGRQPLLIAIDDLQWVDPASARVINFVLRRLADDPIRFMGALRIERGSVNPIDLKGAFGDALVRVAVPGLSNEAIGRLIRTRLGVDLSRSAIGAVHEVSEGNPFYALESARGVRGSGSVGADRRDVLRIDELLGERFATLSDDAMDVLRVLSAQGRATHDFLLEAGRTRGAVARGLQDAIGAGLVEVRAAQVRFSHPLIRSVLYASLSSGTRTRVHLRLASLVSEAGERARHLAAATSKPDSEVAASIAEAAREVQARGAASAAGDLFELAHRTTPREEGGERRVLLLSAAKSHFSAGNLEHSRRLLQQVAAATPAGVARAEILLQMIETTVGSSGTMAKLAAETLEEAQGEASLEAQAWCNLAWAAIIGGDFRKGASDAARSGRSGASG